MADRIQAKIAARNDIPDDDPFAELTRIMGFDPRQPVRPSDHEETEAQGYDFEVDLERELMGEFGGALNDDEPATARLSSPEPETDTGDEAASQYIDDEIAAALDEGFSRDDRLDETAPAERDAEPFGVEAGPEQAAYPDLMDKPVPGEAAVGYDSDVSPAEFEDEFQSFVDESGLGSGSPDVALASEAHRSDVQDDALADAASEADFSGHFDAAMADAGTYSGAAGSVGAEDNFGVDVEDDAGAAWMDTVQPPQAEPPVVEIATMDARVDDAFQALELDFDDAVVPDAVGRADAQHEPLVAIEPVPETAAVDAPDDLDLDDASDTLDVEPVAKVVELPVPVAADPPASMGAAAGVSSVVADPIESRSLEDELNALLGKMGARTTWTTPEAVVSEPPKPVVQSAMAPPIDLAEELESDLSGGDATSAGNGFYSAPAASDSSAFRDFGHDAGRQMNQTVEEIAFDDAAFEAAFANSAASNANPVSQGNSPDFATTPFWSGGASVVPHREVASAALLDWRQPTPRNDSVTVSAPITRDEAPDVETVDVPERVVALADDLDIPELEFGQDLPPVSSYDDLDAEFSGFIGDLNSAEIATRRTGGLGEAAYGGGGFARRPEHPAAAAGFETGPDIAQAPRATEAYAGNVQAYDDDEFMARRPFAAPDAYAPQALDYDPDLDDEMSLAESPEPARRSRGLLVAAVIGSVVIAGGIGALALSFGGKGSGAPVIVKADSRPIKVKPQNPGGVVVPNQDNKVYDAVAQGIKPADPVQQKLVTDAEEPVDVDTRQADEKVVDISPDDADSETDAVAAGPATTDAGANAPALSGKSPAPSGKSEDRIQQVIQDQDAAASSDGIAVAPRKVRTMVVKPDGSLVAREDPAPVVAAAEPADPAPQRVVAEPATTSQSGEVSAPAPDIAPATADSATSAAVVMAPATQQSPAAKAETVAKADADTQSPTTPAMVPVAPQRPSDQPLDIVGEVKPDQVAALDTKTGSTASGSWSMQIASQPTVESAQTTYQDLARRYAGALKGRSVSIVKADIAGKGTFYRVRVPAQSRNDAVALCTSYKAAGGNCFVSR